MTTTPVETEFLGPRVVFAHACPRCGFKHPKARACPRCSDTYSFDTEWTSCYNDYVDDESDVELTETVRVKESVHG